MFWWEGGRGAKGINGRKKPGKNGDMAHKRKGREMLMEEGETRKYQNNEVENS
jgi:hypothetical protein